MSNLGCSVVAPLLTLFLYAIFARIILSWFPRSPGSALGTIGDILVTITEPVLGPLRRSIPSIGVFDLSPIVAIIGIRVLQAIVC